jgi:hypothetical protein
VSAVDRDPRDEIRQLDRQAYPWQWQVRDRFGRPRPFGFGITNDDNTGRVVAAVVGPDYWTADSDTCKQIQFAWRGLCQRVEDEQALRDQQASES